ncbi:MAG: hypothetical protein WBL25_02240 [Anaerolineales bacterium]
MTVENEKDLAGLKKIGRIIALTLREMQEDVQAGMTTAELDDIGGSCLQKYGARSAPFLSTGADHILEGGNGWTLETMDGSLSAQYEHTIVVTRGRPLIVTSL